MRTLVTLLISGAVVASAMAQSGQSNIDPSGQFAWGENVGWINLRGEGTATDANHPAPLVTESHITGFAWGENIGWINLGDGSNSDPNQHGVIVDNQGLLSGYAWAENVGWINFGTGFGAAGVQVADMPMVDLGTGAFSGYAWGENIGWINLSGAQVSPANTDQIVDGLLARTGMPLFADRNDDNDVDAADVVTSTTE